MATLTYYLKRANSKELYIMAKLRNGSEEKSKSTGKRIPSNLLAGKYRYWDRKKQRVTGYVGEKDINAFLASWEANFASYLKGCAATKTRPDIYKFAEVLQTSEEKIDNIVEVVAEINVRKPEDKGPSTPLSLFFNEFIRDHKKHRKPGTIYGYDRVQKDVIAFDELRKEQTFLQDVCWQWYKEFAEYLFEEKKNVNNTTKGKLEVIRLAVEYAKDKKKYINTTEHQKLFEIQKTLGNKFSLFPEELILLQNYVTDNPVHRLVLDAFLVATETGLRYSDAVLLKPPHLQRRNVEGVNLDIIDFSAFKTDARTTTPISAYALSILSSYKPEADNDTFFKLPDNRVLGYFLKDIFKDAGINRIVEVVIKVNKKTTREFFALHEIITFHMARNTYISRLLSAGVPIVYVKDNVGHAHVKTTMAYYRENEQDRWRKTLAVQNAILASENGNTASDVLKHKS